MAQENTSQIHGTTLISYTSTVLCPILYARLFLVSTTSTPRWLWSWSYCCWSSKPSSSWESSKALLQLLSCWSESSMIWGSSCFSIRSYFSCIRWYLVLLESDWVVWYQQKSQHQFCLMQLRQLHLQPDYFNKLRHKRQKTFQKKGKEVVGYGV